MKEIIDILTQKIKSLDRYTHEIEGTCCDVNINYYKDTKGYWVESKDIEKLIKELSESTNKGFLVPIEVPQINDDEIKEMCRGNIPSKEVMLSMVDIMAIGAKLYREKINKII